MLLLEAGPAFASDAVPGELGNPEQVPAPNFDWGYTARGGASTTEMAVPRGRVLGGSSAVNAAVAIRARRQDVESWQIHGVEGWAWDEVLETFKVLENTDSGDDTYRGVRARCQFGNAPTTNSHRVSGVHRRFNC